MRKLRAADSILSPAAGPTFRSLRRGRPDRAADRTLPVAIVLAKTQPVDGRGSSRRRLCLCDPPDEPAVLMRDGRSDLSQRQFARPPS